jgi:Peptidase C13 family
MADVKHPERGEFARVQDHALNLLGTRNAETTNLYLDNRILKKGEVIAIPERPIKITRNTIMVFADEAPHLNWGHACSYLLYDAEKQEHYETVSSQFPPYMVSTPETFRPFHEPVIVARDTFFWPVIPKFKCPHRIPSGERYAILYSGASNNRHTNDLEFLYRTLRDIYGFKAANIICLNYDGTINYNGGPATTWPGDNTAYRMPVNGPGTKAALDNAIDTISAKIKPSDFLLIHTNNHGGYNGPGQAYLCTYSGPSYFAADFGTKLSQMPSFRSLMVMMEQCHSGGFNGPVTANSKATYTSIASACIEPNNSIGGAQFDPFARDWIAAMAGHTPYGGALASNPDANSNGRVSAREAFNYANLVHDPYDTPVYNESSAVAGDESLAQRYLWWWWFCPIFVKLVEPHYLRIPPEEFWPLLHEKVMPQVDKIVAEMEKGMSAGQKETEQRIAELVKQAF